MHRKTSKNRSILRKGKTVAFYSLNRLLEPLFYLILSLLVIRQVSTEFWGEFAIPLMVVRLSYQVLSWGHRDYILKVMSQNPKQGAKRWLSNLVFRSIPIPLFFVLIWLLTPFSNEAIVWLFIWLTGTFFHRAWDVVILYEKHFLISTVIETLSFILMLIVIQLNIDKLSLELMLSVFAIVTLAKFSLYSLLFTRYLRAGIDLSQWKQRLRNSLGFFLPTIVGFLYTRIDLYFVAILMPLQALGQYQVILSFVDVSKNLITFGISPFIKTVYRLKESVTNKMHQLVAIYGSITILLATIIISLILEYYYQFQFSLIIYLLMFLQTVPFAFYQIRTHQLFKYEKQYWVVYISLIVSIINISLNLWLIPVYGLTGALAVASIGQWVVWGMFKWSVNYLQQINQLKNSHAG